VPPPTGEPGCQACLRVRKFLDVDGDGVMDANEETLASMPFEIVEQGDELRYHRRESDVVGEWEICFQRDVLISVREVLRELGGTYETTGEMPTLMHLRCGQDRSYDVGNAPLTRMPSTGAVWTYRQAGGTPAGKPLAYRWAR
jgi:hypothetical protein